MAQQPPPVRRVVTGNGPDGRARIVEDALYAVMDEGETLLRAGDVLIQRGTNHAWSNRSDDYCRICFVLIDGRR